MPGARRAKTAAKENLSQQHTPQSQRKRHDSAGMYVCSIQSSTWYIYNK